MSSKLSLIFVYVLVTCAAFNAQAVRCSEIFHNNPQLLQELHPVHKKWLEYAQAYTAYRAKKLASVLSLKGIILHPVGADIEINNQKYKILAHLGFGGEGSVYIVKTPTGLRSAKVFFDKSNLQSHLYAFSNKTSIRMPHVLESDADRGIVLMSYLEGVPISDLIQHFDEFGVPGEQVQRIVNRFNKMRSRYENIARAGPGNIIYSFITDDFSMIDPQ